MTDKFIIVNIHEERKHKTNDIAGMFLVWLLGEQLKTIKQISEKLPIYQSITFSFDLHLFISIYPWMSHRHVLQFVSIFYQIR